MPMQAHRGPERIRAVAGAGARDRPGAGAGEAGPAGVQAQEVGQDEPRGAEGATQEVAGRPRGGSMIKTGRKEENMPKIVVEIEWDWPDELHWLNADNVAEALHAFCKIPSSRW